MIDNLSRQHAVGQIEDLTEQLTREAEYLSQTARQFADGIATRRTQAGEVSLIAQRILQLLSVAVKLDTLTEAVSYLAPAQNEQDN